MSEHDSLQRGPQSLHRALELLRLLSTRTVTGWRMSDLAQKTGLDHTTVHRLLSGLVHEELATRVRASRRYTIGPLAYALGVSAAPHFAIDRLAAPALSRLADETRDIVFLNIRSGFDSVCVARYEGRRALKAYTVEVGTRRPLCLSAGGVAMLIALPRSAQSPIEVANLQSITHGGEARAAAIHRMLQRSRRLGYGYNQEDIIPSIAAIGVAVLSASGEPVASLSLAAHGADLSPERRRMLLARLRDEAARLSVLLPQLRYGD